MPLCVSSIVTLAVLLIDRLSARQFACIYKFMCMFVCVCMFVHLSVRLYANFCDRLFYILSVCMFPFVSTSDRLVSVLMSVCLSVRSNECM